MKTMQEQIVSTARTWLGTPFHHQARLKDKGCDCLGLIVGVADELGLKDAHGRLLSSYLRHKPSLMPPLPYATDQK